MNELKSFEKLKDNLEKFPSIGAKSAERIAYNLLNMSDEEIEEFISNIHEVKTKIHRCPNCGLLTEQETCTICTDPTRSHDKCILMLDSKDVGAFDKVESFNGVYHVLRCNINPGKQQTRKDSGLDEFLSRIENEKIKEVIVAFGGTIEEEITISIVTKILTTKNIKVSRIARGIPRGQTLEYVDSLTLSDALDGRIEIK